MKSTDLLFKDIIMDKETINRLMVAEGNVGAIKIIRECFGPNMLLSNIDDNYLRIIIWQIMHTMSSLEKLTGIEFEYYADIVEFSETPNSSIKTITSRNLVLAFENLLEYVRN